MKSYEGGVPLVARIDTLLTSVATEKPLRMAGRELLTIAGVDKSEWHFVGDIGGVLLPRKNLTREHERHLEAIRELWTGIGPEHYKRIATEVGQAARTRQKSLSSVPPGVVVLAIDSNKCHAVLRAIELDWINRLACDRHLAETLAEALQLPTHIPSRFKSRRKH